MLAAGNPLQITQPTLAVAMLLSLAAAVICQACYAHHYGESLDLLGVAIRTVFVFANVLLIARFVARWLGSQAAMVAVLVFASTLAVVFGIAGDLQTLCLTGVMYCFARQGVGGRVPVDESVKTWRFCWAGLAFLIVGFGYQAGLPVLATWILFGLISQNVQLLKRLFHPAGLAILTLSAGTSLWLGIPAVPSDQSFLRVISPTLQLTASDFAVLLLPWWPMLIWALYVALREGHYATPWFQFIATWLIVTGMATCFGILTTASGLLMLTPPLALAVAFPLAHLWRLVAHRRRW